MENAKEKIRIMVHDNHDIYREGILQVIRNERSFQLLSVTNGKELITQVRTARPDVLIISMQDKEVDVVRVTSMITRKYPHVGVLAISMCQQERNIVAMLNSGACGFLARTAPQKDFVTAVKMVSKLENYYSPEISAKLVALLTNADLAKFGLQPIEHLSDREVAFIRLLCRGYSMKEISAALGYAVRTLEHRKRKLFAMLDKQNTAGLINYAIVNGIYDPFESAA